MAGDTIPETSILRKIGERFDILENNVLSHAIDFVAISTIFLFAFYAGGNAFLITYFDSFDSPILIDPESTIVPLVSIKNVLIEQYPLLSGFSIVSFIVSYMFIRFVLPVLTGYGSAIGFLFIVFLFILSVFLCTLFGKNTAIDKSNKDKLKTSSLLEIYFDIPTNIKDDIDLKDTHDIRFLGQDANFIYAFKTITNINEYTIVCAVNKNKINAV